MESTFLGLEIGKRSLIAHRKALNVVSHNLANSNNETYSRQRVFLGTIDPLYRNDLTRVERPGQLGQGGEVVAVRRDRDVYLDTRIFREKSALAYWEGTQNNIKELERIYHALEEQNLQQKLDKFWDSWQALSLRSNEPAVREELLQSTELLTRDIRNKFFQLNALKAESNLKLNEQVSQLNNFAKGIAELNHLIEAAEAAGDHPNDLLDKRDAFIEELSSISAVSVSHNDADETFVFINGNILVQGHIANQIMIQPGTTDKYADKYVWQHTLEAFTPAEGELLANLSLRDEIIPQEINQLDTLTVNLSSAVNEIHNKSFNLYGANGGNFFATAYPGVNGNGSFDTTQDGVVDSTLLFKVTGGTPLAADAVIGAEGVLTFQHANAKANANAGTGNAGLRTVQLVYRADETIASLMTRINNSEAGVNAYLNFESKLVIKSYSETPRYAFALPYLEDTGSFLTSISAVLRDSNVPFTSTNPTASEQLADTATFERTPLQHPSAWVRVREDLRDDGGLIAARGGSNYDITPGPELAHGSRDSFSAAAIARLRFDNTLFDNRRTLNEYYTANIIALGSSGKAATIEIEKYNASLQALQAMRQAVSGVNIDEELANMIAYQQGYQASARIVKVMDELLEILLTQVG